MRGSARWGRGSASAPRASSSCEPAALAARVGEVDVAGGLPDPLEDPRDLLEVRDASVDEPADEGLEDVVPKIAQRVGELVAALPPRVDRHLVLEDLDAVVLDGVAHVVEFGHRLLSVLL